MTNATLEQMQEIERAADEVLAGYQHQIRELQDQAARDLKVTESLIFNIFINCKIM